MNALQKRIDARHLDGAAVVWRTHYALGKLDCGRVLLVTASDPNSASNLEAFCKTSGNELLQHVEWDGEHTFLLRKACSPDPLRAAI
jgi:tRNA 2-thiouridine synthesizing protein A